MDAELEAQIAQRVALLGRVQALIVGRLHLDLAPDEIDPDAPLLGAGGGLDLDSMDALELLVVIESEFRVTVSDERLALRVLRSANAVVDFVLESTGSG